MATITGRPRSIETVTVTKATEGAFTVNSGWTFGNDRCKTVKVGDTLLVETIGISRVVGIMDADTGVWYFHDTDEALARQDREHREAHEARKREALDANREEWASEEAALPEWVRVRIEHFRSVAGERFERDGWGYELAIAMLAVLYAESVPEGEFGAAYEFVDTEAIEQFARTEGTSGNQHSMAKALARIHLDGQSLRGTVSALSPITGEPFYVEVD